MYPRLLLPFRLLLFKQIFRCLHCSNSPTGEGTFRFSSKDAAAILRSIRRFISIAMATKQRMLRSSGEVRVRTESTTASYQHILDRSGRPRTGSEEGRERADETPRAVLSRSVSSSSSSSTLPMPGSPCPDISEEGAAADDDDDSAPLVTTAIPITTTQRKSSASSGNDPHNETNDWQQQHELVWNKRRRPGMPRNSSVPNVVTLATDVTGYIIIDRGRNILMFHEIFQCSLFPGFVMAQSPSMFLIREQCCLIADDISLFWPCIMLNVYIGLIDSHH